jgi:hypothetical protein
MATSETELRETQEDTRRPYASPSNIIEVIKRCRSRNLPEVIDSEFFRIVGLTDVVFGRVREALGFLGLIEEDGRPTALLDSIARASDDEYRGLMEATIRDAYREDFQRVDPGEDTQARIVSAFQRYQPRSQVPRMVMLFLGLCREAGIPVLEAPRQRKMVGAPARPRPRTAARKRPEGSGVTNAGPGSGKTQVLLDSNLLFGVTEADIAALSPEEFNEVWTALGKVARARATAQRRQVEEQREEESEESP